ncbi:MAG: GNAT family N-acetyltransferase [Mycobacteriaceae bacterium]|uniref:GNAT family N-acetyltransferase n=1 Tax=Corynebacterium sp. TaxID=1720 RepID=UPI003F9C4429
MADEIIVARIDSPEAEALVEELDHEYTTRYEDYEGFDKPEDAPEELELFPPLVFEEPYGTLLLVRRDGQSIAGGAFMYLDDDTAEVKRVWTASSHRRQGLSRTVMHALEEEAARRGYRGIYLTTGPRQPEAANLYVALGYTPLFDLQADPEDVVHLAFEKVIGPGGGVVLGSAADVERAKLQRDAVERTYVWRPRPEIRLIDGEPTRVREPEVPHASGHSL